ncbi:MAG: hypothetical protein R3F35_01630 [Myxococcota bacterium]
MAARLLTVAATARSIDDFLAALSLVASVDVRAEVPEPVTELDVLLRTFPRYLRVPLEAAVEAHRSGEDPVWAFETRLHRDLDEATRRRLLDAAFDGIELRELPPEELARRFERIDPADVETFSRVVTELRATPISEQLERFMTGGEPEWGR